MHKNAIEGRPNLKTHMTIGKRNCPQLSEKKRTNTHTHTHAHTLTHTHTHLHTHTETKE